MSRVKGTTGELLLEVGTEEIPSLNLPSTLLEMKDKAERLLKEVRLPAERVETFGTPRRLVLHVAGIPKRQESLVSEVIGPPRSAAYDGNGHATAAAKGFARSQGVPLEKLVVRKTEKGDGFGSRSRSETTATGFDCVSWIPESDAMGYDGAEIRAAHSLASFNV